MSKVYTVEYLCTNCKEYNYFEFPIGEKAPKDPQRPCKKCGVKGAMFK